MAAGNTYTPIATTTLSGVSSYTFTSISGSYTDLILIGSINGVSSAADIWYRVGNGSVDTASNYSWIWLSGTNGAGIQAERATANSKLYIDGWGTIGTGNSIIKTQINNYSNTTTYKSVLTQRTDAAKEANAQVGLWRSTSAINTLQLGLDSGTFNSGTVLTLYGIAAA
jgi:hypothetical protein